MHGPLSTVLHCKAFQGKGGGKHKEGHFLVSRCTSRSSIGQGATFDFHRVCTSFLADRLNTVFKAGHLTEEGGKEQINSF